MTEVKPTDILASLPSTITNNNVVNTPQSRATRGGFFNAHQFHHSQFQKQNNVEDNMICKIKNLIIEGPLVKYENEKVLCRDENVLIIRDLKVIREELIKRKKDVFVRGFKSDPREPYKPIGELYLDSDLLVLNCLKIDQNSVQKASNNKTAEISSKVHEVRKSNGKGSKDLPQNQSNGISFIKERLLKSKMRLHAVKFGIPFLEVLASGEKKLVEEVSKTVKTDTEENDLDWMHLKIDPEKQTYYQLLLEKRKKSLAATGSTSESLKYNNSNESKIKNYEKNKAQKVKKRDKKNNSVVPIEIEKKFGSVKRMEEALNINQNDKRGEATTSFLQTRDTCFEQRHRLTQLLYEDLNRVDLERKSNFKLKIKNFDVSKNIGFVDDLQNMRIKAKREKIAEKNAILNEHPWYRDLINKVVNTGGIKRKTSPYETLLIERVKGVIEDKRSFSQLTFVQMLKVIPTHEFTKDEIQRIIRFIKQHETITERDYIEAIELAGHQI
ncbi:hypothetical protein HDU92_003114 [Lobulomyces angularis]|nr:hypothetical protein HDU92_003114 [Lobulomyces angularis]